MTTPSIQAWFAVHVTLKHLVTGASLTLRLSNRMPVGETSVIYYPLLKSISGMGLALGMDGMPVQSTGTISIKDGYCSIGEEKRIFDLLEEYTPINQTVYFYDAKTSLSDTSPYADMALRWQGVCRNVSKSFSEEEQTLTFSIESQTIPQKAISASLDDTNLLSTSTNPAPVESARGKVLPWVFAQDTSNVPGIQYRLDSASAYAFSSSTRGLNPQETTSADLTHIYAKDDNGIYQHTYIPAGANGVAVVQSGTTGATYPSAYDAAATERAYEILYFLPAQDAVLVSGGRWRFKGLDAIFSLTGTYISFTLWECNEFLPNVGWGPSRALATVTVPKADYHSLVQGASDFWMYFQFPEPVLVRKGGTNPVKTYALSMKMDDYSAAADFFDGGHTAPQTSTINWDNDGTAWILGSGSLTSFALFELYCISSTWATNTSSGRNVRTLQMGQMIDVIRGSYLTQINCEFMSRTKGSSDQNAYIPATDDYSTTCITRPDHVAAAITGDWNGTSWVKSSQWDFDVFATECNAVFSTTHDYNRRINGFLEGRQTQDAYLRALCAEAACKIVQRRDGKFTLWPWGGTGTVIKVFTDEDIFALNSWERLDSSSVVNKAQVFGGKGYKDIVQDVQNAQDTWANYSLSQTRDYNTSNYDNFLIGTSNTLYGASELKTVETNLLGDTQSLNTLCEYYFRVHDHPHTVCSFEADYYANNTLELLDIIEIVSAMLPASGGTSLNGREATYTSEEVLAHNGQYVTKAQRYRAQLVGWSMNWSAGSLPALTLEARIIKPYHPHDPT